MLSSEVKLNFTGVLWPDSGVICTDTVLSDMNGHFLLRYSSVVGSSTGCDLLLEKTVPCQHS